MTLPVDVIAPAKGLSREIGLMVAALEEVRTQTVALIADMSGDELAQRFVPGVHQIGSLVLHIGENEFWWIEAIFAQKEISEADRQFAHLDNTTEEDFALKGYSAEDCIDFLDRIHKRTTSTLSSFDDARLDQITTVGSDPVRFQGSLRWILHHLIDHESHHKGQISMLKRLIRHSGNWSP
jgi:uncharacterized damage-inducible protein DinB